MKNFDLNMKKLEALIHYICFKADRDQLSAVKLHKILWYAEATYYLQYKEPIAGETYVKGPHGPMSPHADKAIKNLKNQDKLAVSNVKYYSGYKREYVPLVNPDLLEFSAREISHVDSWIEEICRGTASDISNYSHNEIWKVADMGEDLPYSAAIFAPAALPSVDCLAWAESIEYEESLTKEALEA